MRDTDYAFCVARIRANEKKMLSSAFIDKLIDCDTYNQAVTMLMEAGWIDAVGELSDYIREQNNKLWMLLYESVPDKKELNALCVLNDFFNIKAAVKCLFSGETAEHYYIQPTSLDLNELTDKLNKQSFDFFGEKVTGDAVKSAYELVCKTHNGQNAEILIDNAALTMLKQFSLKYKNTSFSDICAFITDTSNIKTAFRCVNTRKNSDFINSAISDCCRIDRKRLIDAANSGIEALCEYLEATDYTKGVQLYLESPLLFEKWCDSKVISFARYSKYTAFGFDPVCAYYYAKLDEIKKVRTILFAKQSGVSKEILKERVGKSYV